MSRVAKQRASRSREFIDMHQEYMETRSPDALRRRNEAMHKGSPEDAKRNVELATVELVDKAQGDKDRLRRARAGTGSQGWRRKR